MPDTPPAAALRKPGWYRVTKDGWTWIEVPGIPGADVLVMHGLAAVDVVLVETAAEEVPLW